jgi:hypothetical protein
MQKLIFLFFILLSVLSAEAQIRIDNASFEGEAQDATMPNGWLSCKQGTTPDILPGSWGVNTEPSEGETYIGLITRPDGSWESIGQRLLKPILKGSCYTMSLDLSHSDTYTGYNQPARLRIWGGRARCDRRQMLWESELIEHSNWETYEIEFTPGGTFHYIIIEAYFPTHYPSPHKGNVLIDNMSPIQKCKRA